MIRRRRPDVVGLAVLEAWGASDAALSNAISVLPTNLDSQPTAGVFRSNSAAWESRVRAYRELHNFRQEVLDADSADFENDALLEWELKFVTKFGDSLIRDVGGYVGGPEFQFLRQQGQEMTPSVIANATRPNVARALGGIGSAGTRETRVHKVGDAWVLGRLIEQYVSQAADQIVAAYGLGWTMCSWVGWSDRKGLVG